MLTDERRCRCALRETFETTGLRPKDLRVEEGFKIELKYLSGTRYLNTHIFYIILMVNHGINFQAKESSISTCTDP